MVTCKRSSSGPDPRSNKSVKLSRRRSVNTALEKYRVDHGSFPENLEELIPDYLESISKPRLFGRQLRLQLLSRVRWQYRLSSDEDNYVLWISDSSEFGYSSVSGEWGRNSSWL